MYGNKALPTRIYSYKARPPFEGGGRANDQIKLAHRYANNLIEVERGRRTAVDDAIRCVYPEVFDLDASLGEVEAELDALIAVVEGRNQKARGRTGTQEERAAIKGLKVRKTALFAARKEARARAFSDEALKSTLEGIEEGAKLRQKALRAECGVYWGTYLFVEQSLSRTRKGPPPKFRRFYGDGTLAVQCQKGLPWVDALSGADTRVRVQIEPASSRPRFNKRGQPLPAPDPNSRRSREKSRVVVWARIGTEPDGRTPIWLKALTHLHRHPPSDSRIQWVYLQKNLTGGREWWEAQFVLAHQEGWEKEGSRTGVAGIDVGWRKVPGGLRVAMLCGDDGHKSELVLPDEWLAAWSKAKSLRSIRDREFDAIRGRLVRFLAGPVPDWLRERTENLPLWKSCDRLAAVVLRWREGRFAGDEEIYAAAEAWRRQDRHLNDWAQANVTKAIRRRDRAYRIWAAALRHRYATLKIEAINVKQMQGRPGSEDDGQDAARGDFTIAAVGRLVQLCCQQFWNVGEVDPVNSTRMCSKCGEVHETSIGPRMMHTCPKCGETWDRDDNAATNIRDSEVVAWRVKEGVAIKKEDREVSSG